MVIIAILLALLLIQFMAMIAMLIDSIIAAIYGYNCHMTGLNIIAIL